MKRTLCLLLASIMALALVGCDRNNVENQAQSSTPSQERDVEEDIETRAGDLDEGYKNTNTLLEFFQAEADEDSEYVYEDGGIIFVLHWYGMDDASEVSAETWDKIKGLTSSSRETSIELAKSYGYSDCSVVYRVVSSTDHSKVLFEVDANGDETDYSDASKVSEDDDPAKNEATKSTSTDEFIKEVNGAAENGIGEGESITGVELKNRDLCVYVDLSMIDPAPLTMAQLAESRVSSITDSILEITEYDNLWDTITIDFGDIGKCRNDKSNIGDDGYGRYFISANFKLE